jgi:hypothetical protein
MLKWIRYKELRQWFNCTLFIHFHSFYTYLGLRRTGTGRNGRDGLARGCQTGGVCVRQLPAQSVLQLPFSSGHTVNCIVTLPLITWMCVSNKFCLQRTLWEKFKDLHTICLCKTHKIQWENRRRLQYKNNIIVFMKNLVEKNQEINIKSIVLTLSH